MEDDELDYYFSINERNKDVFVLIIYDITDNQKRTKLAKFLQGYGFRVQKSAFEAIISKRKYKELINILPSFVSKEDSVKIYKIIGKGQVISFGKEIEIEQEDIIII